MNEDLFGKESLKGEYCKACPLKGNKFVDTFGNLETAKVLFVGQCPGKEEVIEGMPFVGKAGKLLKETLFDTVGFHPSEVAFSNVVRCRSVDRFGNNREPTEKEIQCCVKYLKKEIERFKGLVVLLGRVALQGILRRKSVEYNKGYGFFEDGQKYYITYHPMAIGYDPEKRLFFEESLKVVEHYIHNPPKIKYKSILSADDFINFVNKFKDEKIRLVAFDIETSGISPYDRDGKIYSISFSWKDEEGQKTWFVPLEHPASPFKNISEEFMDMLTFIFENEDVKLVGHGGKFDINWLKMKYKILVKNYYFDTWIAHYLAWGLSFPAKLKSLAWRFTDYGGYDIDVTKLGEANLEELGNYSAMDTFITYEIAKMYFQELSEKQKKLLTTVLAPAIMAVGEIEREGFKVDEEKLRKFSIEYKTKIQELEKKLHSHPVVKEIEEEKGQPLNFNSSQQLRELLERMLTVPKARTKKGAISTKKKALEEIKTKNPIVSDLLKYREASKIQTTYLTPYSEMIKESDVIRGDYGFARTVTGRLACHKPNFQNIPLEVRPVFTAKNDWLIEADFCLHSDTFIECLGGKKKIKDIVKEISENKKIYVYCYRFDKKRIGLSEVIEGKKTGENQELWRIVLDNGKEVKATLEHKFLTRNGKYVELRDLKIGDSLMAFYSSYRKKSKEQVVYRWIKLCSASLKVKESWIKEHRLVAEDVMGYTKEELFGKPIHHKDGCGINNLPENLKLWNQSEHFSFHRNKEEIELAITGRETNRGNWAKTEEGRKYFRERAKKQWKNMSEDERNYHCKKIGEGCKGRIPWNKNRSWSNNERKRMSLGRIQFLKNNPDKILKGKMNPMFGRKGKQSPVYKRVLWRCNYCKVVEKIQPHLAKRRFHKSCYLQAIREKLVPSVGDYRWGNILNHKIVKIEKYGYSDVYNINVKNAHNFVLSSGIIAKNSQLELRVLAAYSKDKELIKCFKEGYDIHEETRRSIEHLISKESKKRQRVIAKSVNFGIIYQETAFGLARQLGISESKAQQMIDELYARFKGVAKWVEDIKKSVRKMGYVETFFGRVRRFTFTRNDSENEKRYKEAINFPIQSGASDLVLAKTGQVWQEMRKRNLDGHMVAHIHDSILFDIPDSELEEMLLLLPEMMERADFDWLIVPLKIDLSIGKNWGELTNFKEL